MTANPSSFRETLLRLWSQRNLPTDITFAEGEVVSAPTPIAIGPMGHYLKVPINVCAVIAHPSGQLVLYATGEHTLRLPTNSYIVRYVSLLQQQSLLPEVTAPANDAWDVTLKVKVVWRVVQPKLMLGLTHHHRLVQDACAAALNDVIQSLPHDGLVRAPNAEMITERTIADMLQERLTANRALGGIEVLEANVLSRRGDRRRVEEIHKAIVKQTEYEQAAFVQDAQFELQQQRVEKELQLTASERALALARAENTRMVAEEQDRVRLAQAQNSAEEDRTLFEIKQRAFQLESALRQQQFQHEEVQKSMEVRSQIFGQMSAAILQNQANPGIMRPLDDTGREALIQAVASMSHMPLVQSPALLPATPPASLLEKVQHEVVGMFYIPHLQVVTPEVLPRSDPNQPESVMVEVFYQGFHINIRVEQNFPAVPPDVWVGRGEGAPDYHFPLNWSMERSLREVVLEVAGRMPYEMPHPVSTDHEVEHEA